MPSLPLLVRASPLGATGARVGPRSASAWVAAALAGLALAVYGGSLLPGVGYSGDAAKWQMLAAVGGVPHATGYPLYVALTQAFESLVPFGSAAWTTNLFSALCGAAAVAVVFALQLILRIRRTVAAATSLTFALTPVFWSQAVVAEVYTLHILLMASVLACLARWRRGGRDRWLLAGIGLLSLSFGNHMTTVLLLPSVGWLVWADRHRALTRRNLVWAGLAAGFAAGQYLYLLYMHDVGRYSEVAVDGVGDLWGMVTGGPFKDQMLAFSLRQLLFDRLPLLGAFVRQQYSLPLLLPVGLGLWRGLGGRGNRDMAIALVLLGAGSAAYGLEFDVPDVEVFFLPLFLVLAVFLGLGLDGIVSAVARCWPDDRRAGLALASALTVLPAATGVLSYRTASQRHATADAERVEQALEVVGDHAVLLTDNYADSAYFWYYLLGERMAETRDLALVHQATVRQIQDYFRGGLSPVADAAARVGGPARPPLYTASRRLPADAARAGLGVTRVSDDVWRIDP